MPLNRNKKVWLEINIKLDWPEIMRCHEYDLGTKDISIDCTKSMYRTHSEAFPALSQAAI